MKKNNQGFMLVEALIMSTVVIGVLVFMFIQFQTLNRNYDKSFNYNTVTGLYYANEIRNFLITNENFSTILNNLNANENKYITLYSQSSNYFTDNQTWNKLLQKEKIKTIILADEKLSNLKGKRTTGFTEKMNDFINYIKIDNIENAYRLVIELNNETYASVRIEGIYEK